MIVGDGYFCLISSISSTDMFNTENRSGKKLYILKFVSRMFAYSSPLIFQVFFSRILLELFCRNGRNDFVMLFHTCIIDIQHSKGLYAHAQYGLKMATRRHISASDHERVSSYFTFVEPWMCGSICTRS